MNDLEKNMCLLINLWFDDNLNSPKILSNTINLQLLEELYELFINDFCLFYSLPLKNFTSSAAAWLACRWSCRLCSQRSSPRSVLCSSEVSCWTHQTCSLQLKASSKCSTKRQLSKKSNHLLNSNVMLDQNVLPMVSSVGWCLDCVFSCIPEGQEIRRSCSQTCPPSQCCRRGGNKSRLSSMKSKTIAKKSGSCWGRRHWTTSRFLDKRYRLSLCLWRRWEEIDGQFWAAVVICVVCVLV